MTLQNPRAIFDAVRSIAGSLDQSDVDLLNNAIVAAEHGDELPPQRKASGPQIGVKGLSLVKEFEGCKLTAYLCPANVWTIGYGSTGPHVRRGLTLTEKQADDLLQEDLDRFEAAVAKHTKNTSQNEFDAMVSLAFNIGTGGFARSSVLRRHNAGNKNGAAEAFLMWNKGGGRVLNGLVRRREAEKQLYLS